MPKTKEKIRESRLALIKLAGSLVNFATSLTGAFLLLFGVLLYTEIIPTTWHPIVYFSIGIALAYLAECAIFSPSKN